MMRKWIPKIKNRMTREKRAAFHVKVVTKKKRADGTTAVILVLYIYVCVATLLHICSHHLELDWPRTGNKLLKGTQVYPKAFARAIAALHWKKHPGRNCGCQLYCPFLYIWAPVVLQPRLSGRDAHPTWFSKMSSRQLDQMRPSKIMPWHRIELGAVAPKQGAMYRCII